ncbi:MAG: SET domain-containing protein-lysine N-methyltransferase [Saprospiraceae bacterium]|nr:SET domain-containing protein-lysine N-methyltransferase [Saprospiraceae bacterium]
MHLTQIPGLYIAVSDLGGKGVFTSSAITKGDLIEICPLIILSAVDTSLIHKTKLHDYYFVWDDKQKTSAIALGFGSIYNHSPNPNAEFNVDHSEEYIRFSALKNIMAGEEIKTKYLSSDDPEYKLWF